MQSTLHPLLSSFLPAALLAPCESLFISPINPPPNPCLLPATTQDRYVVVLSIVSVLPGVLPGVLACCSCSARADPCLASGNAFLSFSVAAVSRLPSLSSGSSVHSMVMDEPGCIFRTIRLL